MDVSDKHVAVLTSENFPHIYPRDHKYTWLLKVKPGSQITIRLKYALLFPGDKLSIVDIFDHEQSLLSKFYTHFSVIILNII